MVWAAWTFAAYSIIRTSTVAAASVSMMFSLVVALLVADLLSPSRPVRRALAMVFAPVLVWLHKPGSHSGRNQEI